MTLRRLILPILLVTAACATVGSGGQLVTNASFIVFSDSAIRAAGGDEATWDTFQLNTSRINQRLNETFPALQTFDSDESHLRFFRAKTVFDRKKGQLTFGYILFKPGKEPMIFYGMHDPDELYCAAVRYFTGLASPDCKGK
jgi:hypothetical protein